MRRIFWDGRDLLSAALTVSDGQSAVTVSQWKSAVTVSQPDSHWVTVKAAESKSCPSQKIGQCRNIPHQQSYHHNWGFWPASLQPHWQRNGPLLKATHCQSIKVCESLIQMCKLDTTRPSLFGIDASQISNKERLQYIAPSSLLVSILCWRSYLSWPFLWQPSTSCRLLQVN